jgi:hypothetical protein
VTTCPVEVGAGPVEAPLVNAEEAELVGIWVELKVVDIPVELKIDVEASSLDGGTLAASVLVREATNDDKVVSEASDELEDPRLERTSDNERLFCCDVVSVV